MIALEIFWVALASLRANLMRSLLTMLGVIIGVAAVITMVGLGEGAQAQVQAEIEALGTNRLVVRSGAGFFGPRGRGRGAEMTVDDALAILQRATSITGLVPVVDRRDINLEYGNFSGSASVIGTWVGYPEMNNWRVEAGRFFAPAEQDGYRRVAVIGSEIAANLFPDTVDPVGQEIRLRGISFEVIGVLEEKGDSGWRSRDDVVVVPLSTAQRRLFGTDQIEQMTVEAISEEHLTMAMAEIESVLRRQHRLRPGQDNDFNIRRQTEFLSVAAEAGETFTYLLAGIAGVSLLVGGIGIMNIMLVSVTERTREIGVRKAVGWLASRQLAQRAGWQMLVSADAVGLAFGFAAFIGIVFGFYPARRASRLDPIDALRYD